MDNKLEGGKCCPVWRERERKEMRNEKRGNGVWWWDLCMPITLELQSCEVLLLSFSAPSSHCWMPPQYYWLLLCDHVHALTHPPIIIPYPPLPINHLTPFIPLWWWWWWVIIFLASFSWFTCILFSLLFFFLEFRLEFFFSYFMLGFYCKLGFEFLLEIFFSFKI